MHRAVWLYIDLERCQACSRCKAAKACRQRAIVQMDPDESPYLDAARCRDCRACIQACEYGAIRLISEEKTPNDP